MTCIVGLVDQGTVYIGGDSAGVSGLSLRVRRDQKVFRGGSFLFGFTSSFRMGQLLAHTFTPPPLKVGQDVFAFMVADFVPAVRRCFETGGWARSSDGVYVGGAFLVGYCGRLFCIESDFQVAETPEGFYAVGSGAEVALGALWALGTLPAVERISTALHAAEALNAGVRGPFVVRSSADA